MIRTLRRAENLAHERLIGIDTGGVETTRFRPDAVFYATVDYGPTRRILRELLLEPDDTFVEVGAGKGRVLCLAARNEMAKVVGIEADPRLAQIARDNVQRARGKRTPTVVHTGMAEDYDYRHASVLYYFNPFEANVLDTVLDKIRADRAGPVRLAFVMESASAPCSRSTHGWSVRPAGSMGPCRSRSTRPASRGRTGYPTEERR